MSELGGERPLPNRQSIRLKGWDYTSPGIYFVTINTHHGRPLFGTVVNGRMVLSAAGRLAEEEWRKSAEIRPSIALDEFVVMPNHVHGIVRLKGLDASSPSPDASSPSPDASSPSPDASSPSPDASSPSRSRPQFGKPIAGSLGAFVGAYKAAVSRAVRRLEGLMHQTRSGMPQNQAIWHRNYWDVIVRDDAALRNIRNYIRANPVNYDAVINCGKPRLVGNAELMALPKLGFLASREAPALSGKLPLKPGMGIISGFLSPMERRVFHAGLKRGVPMIWVKPWGPEVATDSGRSVPEDRSLEVALREGRLLVVSPFADDVEAPSVRRAAWCNEYVINHCERLVLGHLKPGGMLECLLSDAPPELEIRALAGTC